jgi:hypothetical protein
MKRQAQIALDKASKSCGFMKQISTLEDKVSGLVAKIVHLEECDSFLIVVVSLVRLVLTLRDSIVSLLTCRHVVCVPFVSLPFCFGLLV